jgi:ubiquinone/menaquinone biosynthesis C-methylase UbiE
VKLFRSGPPPHQTALAMVGAKPGSTVLLAGGGDPALAAEIALVTGLNGRTLVVDPSVDERARIEAAAARAGALVEIETAPLTKLPAIDAAFDIAVINELGDSGVNRDQIVREATRVVRTGGRVVVIEGKKSAGLRKLWGRGGDRSTVAGDEIIAWLGAAGLRATRLLGQAEGISYFEGMK